MSFSGLTPSFVKALIANMKLDTDVHYFGDKDTDGSWRIIRDSGDLKIQLRDAGSWVTQFNANSLLNTLDNLSDVNATTPADGDVLTYNDLSGTWVNQAPSGGGTVHYFGDQNTDGSWRIILDLGDLKIEKRVAGVWITKDTIQ